MSGYSLNPNAVEFSFPNENSSSWNAQAIDFVPFEPSPPPPKSSSPPIRAPVPEVQKPLKKIYTYEVLISLRESNRQLPEGISIPDTYSKTGSKAKNTKKGSQGSQGSQASKPSAIKRAENQLNNLSILVKTEKPFTEMVKKQADEHEKKSREIRSILNKLTDRNFEKLLIELTSFQYDQQLLGNLTNFIFERATAMNFPKLYSKLCQALRANFKEKNISSIFRKSIVEKCRECFYNEDTPMENDKLMEAEFKRRRRLIGNIKFIALLHQAKMIKSEIMFECFEVLLEPKSLSDETLETCITLFKDTCPILIGRFPEDIHKYYEKMVGFLTSTLFSRRIIFMIHDLIDVKDQIMVASHVRSSPVKKIVQVVQSAPTESKGLNEHTKQNIKNLTGMHLSGMTEEDWNERFQAIFTANKGFTTEIIVQILKHSLYENNVVEKTMGLCAVIKTMVKSFNLDENCVQLAMLDINKDFAEIMIDSPKSIDAYSIMEKEFKQIRE